MTDLSKNKQLQTDAALQTFIDDQKELFVKALADDSISWTRECLFAKQILINNKYAMEVARNNPLSLKNAILNVAAIGVSLNPALAHSYLVPEQGQIKLRPGYRGLIAVATSTGAIKSVSAWAIHTEDDFEMGYDQEKGEYVNFTRARGERGGN